MNEKKIHLQSLSLTESDFQLQWQSNSFDAIGGEISATTLWHVYIHSLCVCSTFCVSRHPQCGTDMYSAVNISNFISGPSGYLHVTVRMKFDSHILPTATETCQSTLCLRRYRYFSSVNTFEYPKTYIRIIFYTYRVR